MHPSYVLWVCSLYYVLHRQSTHVYYNAKVLGDHSSIMSAKRWVCGVRKWQFLLIYSSIYADVAGWVGLKKAKNMKT